MIVRPFTVLAAVLSLAMTALCAHADTLQTFQVQNSFVYPSSGSPAGSMTGTMVIDTTSGQFVSADLTYVDSATTIQFNTPATGTNPFDNDTQTFTNFDNGTYILNFDLPVASLVGYNGGAICGTSGGCNDGYFGFIVLDGDPNAYVWSDSGSLTPTPEPSSFLLLGTGLLGLGATVKRRLMA